MYKPHFFVLFSSTLALLLVVTSLAAIASAQIPTKGNVFFGYSYDNTAITRGDSGSLNGWDASLEGKLLPWVGLVVDIDGHYGSRDYPVICNGLGICSGPSSANVTEHNFLFGPRVSVQVRRFRPFAEFLIGGSHVSRSNGISDSNTSFANAVGGGLDYKVFGPVSVRGQLDWIETRNYGETQNGVRFSTGIALHF
jgi:opacity protein-like surface antigen